MQTTNTDVLCIDVNADKITKYCFAFRRRSIYQNQSFKRSWIFNHCLGSKAIAKEVDSKIQNQPPVFISASGHGSANGEALLDENRESIFAIPVKLGKFARCIIHCLSCFLGGKLGIELVREGKAEAFFGYSSYFEIPYSLTLPPTQDSDWEGNQPEPYDPLLDKDAEVCLEMDLLVDKAILSKFSAECVSAEIENYFINQTGAYPPISAEVRRSLSHNYASFVAPSVDFGGSKIWGEEKAQLT